MVLLLLSLACAAASPPDAPGAQAAAVEAAAVEGSAAPACPATVEGLPADPQLDPADPRLRGPALVVVLKERRVTALYAEGALAGCWPAALAGAYRPGTKRRQGDNRTPEGWYRTSDKPWSQFYGAIAVHYPGEVDAAAGLEAGTIDRATHDRIVAAVRRGQKPPQDTALGGEILLHGGGSGRDWTLGCVALEDSDLDALRAGLPAGMRTDVLILP